MLPPLTDIDSVSKSDLDAVLGRALMSTVFVYTNEESKPHAFGGTATCVTFGGATYLLTAGHVWTTLPGTGFALALEPDRPLDGIEKQLAVPKVRYSGSPTPLGPDVALIKLPGKEAGLLPSTKSWRNLARDLEIPVGGSNGSSWLYILVGAPAEMASFGPTHDVLRGRGLPFGVLNSRNDGTFDYIDIRYAWANGFPVQYHGMSGAGLWAAEMIPKGTSWVWTERISLRGVAYFQHAESTSQGWLRCHGLAGIAALAATS
jgi:hypothetical protein